MIDAYEARAAEYVARFGRIEDAAAADRRSVLDWARDFQGPLLDVGCGPGQWTGYLARHGLTVAGVDPTPAFIAAARQQHPHLNFDLGDAEDLAVDDGTLDGVLAWYSLIHTPPAGIDSPLTEFARCVRPGGGLAIGYFAGDECEPFDHAVATTYQWPASALAERIEACGFAVTMSQTRVESATRTHGFITATRIGRP
ncbi:class I SAM-dependent methyltransferase [Demequina sp. NBRC 110057]|uniref:class I SAM-dependent methyltransferase n=1 Tax=Demequina sp. NBRC 110057 TaxID=1570346 RepID=UPI001F3D1439|nr:class I SAM-dependent methyltransferase [Demequina sp. NBRC 110057]